MFSPENSLGTLSNINKTSDRVYVLTIPLTQTDRQKSVPDWELDVKAASATSIYDAAGNAMLTSSWGSVALNTAVTLSSAVLDNLVEGQTPNSLTLTFTITTALETDDTVSVKPNIHPFQADEGYSTRISGYALTRNSNGSTVSTSSGQQGDNPHDFDPGFIFVVEEDVDAETELVLVVNAQNLDVNPAAGTAITYSIKTSKDKLLSATKSYTITAAPAVAIGDPYVYPLLSKTPVKLPNRNAIYRLYECDNTFINAEVLENTPEHIERILSVQPVSKNRFINGYYFSKFYIKEGENYLNIDLREKTWEGHVEKPGFFKLDLDEEDKIDGHDFWKDPCKTLTIGWKNKENKNVTAKVLFFKNPFIENGIKIEVEDLNEKAIGMCVRNYKPKLMQLKNIKQTKYGKLHKNINKKTIYQFKQIKERKEEWVKKENKKWTSI